MSLYGALYSGVSGLKAQSDKIGIISDNISNVNTVGYKAGQAQFQTLVTNSGLSAIYSPGGVLPVNRQLVDKQGLLTTTDSPTDLAISGKGFFAVSTDTDAAGQVLYTRAGSYRQDSTGNFRNAAGYFLLAWPLDRNGRLPGEPGNLNTTPSNNLSSLQVVNVQSVAGVAAATTTVSLGANLKSTETVYPGAGDLIDMDSTDTSNFGIAAKDIITPGGPDIIQRGDKFNIATGSGLSYNFRYGGFTFSRDVTSGAVGDSGAAVLTSPIALGANPFTTANGTTTVTVDTTVAHGLANGGVVTLSGTAAGPYDGIPASDFNNSFVITNVTATTFDITVATTATATTAGTGGAGISVTTRPFTGNILDATTPTSTLLGITGTSGFTTTGLQFTIATPTLGTSTFTYTSTTPNPQQGQFNTLQNLASAINAVNGLTARVAGGILYVSPLDANDSITFANGSTQGVAGPPVQAGIDWVTELGLDDQIAGTDRFNSMQGLADIVNTKTGLAAEVNDPLGSASVDLHITDPLDTVTISDPAVVAAAVVFGATPFTTTTGSNVVVVNTPAAHGLQTGDRVQINNVPAGAYNGLTQADFNGNNFLITVINSSSYSITVATTATATGATGGGAATQDYTGHNNIGSLLGVLGLGATLAGGPYVPATDGPLGPAYDPTNAVKNMTGGLINPQFSRTVRIYDAQGTGHDLTVSFIKTAVNTWAAEVFAVPASELSGGAGQIAYGSISFNGDGSLSTVDSGLTNPITINWSNGASPSEVTFNWGTAGQPFGTVGATVIGKTDGLSQFDSSYNVSFVSQNGAQVGELVGVAITDVGFVIASYSNGQTQEIFKIAMADFTNPNQLLSITGNVYAESSESGAVNLREAGTNGTGKFSSSALESSNVDLAEQLTDMIIAQRAYQANTKVITTTNSLLEDLNRIV